MNKLVKSSYLTFVLSLLLLVSSAFALEPKELLIVYNRNFEGSREVAEYYAKRRGIPSLNLIGVQLPEKENLNREVYENVLYPQIYNAVASLKKAGHKPAILLVYGMPLIVSKANYSGQEQQKRLTTQKIEDLTIILNQLSNRLNELTTSQTLPPTKDKSDKDSSNLADALSKIQSSLEKASKYREKIIPGAPPPENVWEIESIIIRLVGLSTIAQDLEKSATAQKALTDKNKLDNVISLSLLLESQLLKIPFYGVTYENAQDLASTIRVARGLVSEAKFWYSWKDLDPTEQSSASLDSELSLVLAEPYDKAKWRPNPLMKQFDKMGGIEQIRDKVTKVARLDAPTPELAKRLVDDAIWAEENGLKGVFYLDARGEGAKEKAYAQFDEYIKNLYKIIKEKSTFPVVLDTKPAVFPEGSCPNAALYCGWYSRGKYVAAFKWQKGAVGYHIASSEAATLKEKGSQVWCKRMIEEGVAATSGPVQEPYLHSFARPDFFFPLLLSGQMPLIDVYYRTIPLLSWRQVLIGDPLYNPFKKHPAMKLEAGQY